MTARRLPLVLRVAHMLEPKIWGPMPETWEEDWKRTHVGRRLATIRRALDMLKLLRKAGGLIEGALRDVLPGEVPPAVVLAAIADAATAEYKAYLATLKEEENADAD